jgi:hypothetical protein
VSQGARQSSSSRFNGATTPKKKQLGRVKTSSTRATQILHCRSEGTCDCSLSLLGHSPSKSQVKIYCRGQGCDTPSVTIATSVYSTNLHHVSTAIQWQVNFVYFEFNFQSSFLLFSNQIKGSLHGNCKLCHTTIPI